MKKIFRLHTWISILSISICSAQKLVQKVEDAEKLQIKEKEFIGKPLKDLISQIGPIIKFIYGIPENRWVQTTGGTFFKFTFTDKETYFKMHHEKRPVTGITVEFQLEPNSTRKPLPKDGLTSWGSAETQEYGDMIISHIYVSGSN